jgi:hypothetical protein
LHLVQQICHILSIIDGVRWLLEYARLSAAVAVMRFRESAAL